MVVKLGLQVMSMAGFRNIQITFFRLGVCMVLIGVQHETSWAGSWPLPAGKGQIIQTTLAVSADKGFDANGKLDLPVQFSKYETSMFLEHGLNEDFTLVLAANYQNLQFIAGVDQVNFSGFGETEVALRKTIWKAGPAIISLQAHMIFAGPGETITDADLGVGGTQYEVRLLAGRSFKIARKDAFIDVQLARRFRRQNIADEWRFDISSGWRPLPNWQILGQAFYVNGQSAPNLTRSNRRLKAQTSIVYDRNKKTSYQIGVYKTVLGKNVIQENAIFMSIWQRY